jgi:hypothetical protein
LKSAVDVAVPAGVVTATLPAVFPVGTVAVILVADTTVKAAVTPLNVTAVAPVKFVPVRVITVPWFPLVGAKLANVGGWAGATNENPLLALSDIMATVPFRATTRN